MCGKLVTNPSFEVLSLLLILTSCVILALDEPLASNESQIVYMQLDYWLTILFVIEMSLKVIAFGLIRHEGAYFRQPFNVFDGIIVIISVYDL